MATRARRRLWEPWAAVVALAITLSLAPAAAARSPLDIRLNEVQVIGSHNSYHIQPVPDLIEVYLLFDPTAIYLEYTHRPLEEQFALLGIRQIELDIYADPAGGLHAEPLSLEFLAGQVVHLPELDPPGMKVIHIADIDVVSTCPTLVACLQVVKAWSDANPAHLPLMILIEAKDDPPPDLPPIFDFVQPVPFGPAELDAIDAEIRSVFSEDDLLTPDDVRGGRPTLEEAVRRDGWPTLREARGKVLFALDNGGSKRADYIAGHPSLTGRVLFTDSAPGTPEAAFAKLNDPSADGPLITDLVRAGYIVRTRADADTIEARSGDTTRRDAALASGAQFVSTDYRELGPFGTDYMVELPGGLVARCNPVSAPRGCLDTALENLTGEQPVAGKRLIVRDRDGDSARRRITARAADPLIETPLPGSPDDPSIAGAVFELLNPSTGESATFALPAGAGWRYLGKSGLRGYAYSDRASANGPCRSLSMRRGRGFKAVCVGTNGDIPFTLDEPSQGTLAATVKLGGANRHCMTFGPGQILRDTPATGTGLGVFSAKNAPAPAACPDL
jgi:hypothetical protein